jgi:hypothetical protein
MHRDPRFPPYAFAEHGAIMAATILSSPRAVEMSVFVIRAFVRLRELLASNTALARKLDELERKYQHHDEAITAILSAIASSPTRRRPSAAASASPLTFRRSHNRMLAMASRPSVQSLTAPRRLGYNSFRPGINRYRCARNRPLL